MEDDDQENTDFLNGQLGQNVNDEEKHLNINQLHNWQHYADEGLKNCLEVRFIILLHLNFIHSL